MRSESTAAFSDTNNHEALVTLPCASAQGTCFEAGTRPNAGERRRWRSCYGSLLGAVFATVALPALAAASDTGSSINEIIVTAEKKYERLQDVPIPVTEVSADTLVETNQVRIQDFYTRFPGLILTVAQQSAVNLTVRGLPAAITIDDVPISIGTFLEQAGGLSLDLDPSGLSQIEVLRGPQGTLYGANSEGGLLRYVTADPTTDWVKGRFDAGVSTIDNGAEPGWNFRASANLPIGSDVAMLVDAFARQDPGYIDRPILGTDGVNEAHTYGAHLGFLWRPSDALSVKLGAFVQQARGDGTNDVNVEPGLGPYDQNYIAGVGPYQREGQLYNATVKYKVGTFELTSVTGFVWTGFQDTFDGTTSGLVPYAQFGIPGTGFNGFGEAGLVVPENAHSHSLTQEVRLTTQIGNFADVLLGGFYNFAYGEFGENLLSSNPTTGAVAGDFVFVGFRSAARSYAAFANLNFHFTEKFGVQVGGRQEYDRTYAYGTTFAGPGNPIFGIPTAQPTVAPAPNGAGQKFTYLITPQFKFTPDAMLYARAATGYAPGQANPAAPGVPPTSKPDTVTDYEIGVKTVMFDHKWSLDASVYHIKHDDIQAGLFSETAKIYYFGNSGSAIADGAELSSELRPATGLRLSGWVAFIRPKLSNTTGVAGGAAGALNLSPKWSGNLSLDQKFPLGASVTGFAGAAATYLGERGQSGLVFPAYTRVDLNGGVTYGGWTARLYANNVTNKRGIINGGPGTLIPDSYYYITPRVIGLGISKTF
ncbi:MAG TPA: TonB-dependent receptor [Steroidobacteraceae bacterium]|jgi:outer membrane receptor protein involved in Fe transport|nr:TonB-dependent receptor [Steroidobacteraceae bacterium]